MKPWEIRLQHEKDVRELYIQMGNTRPLGPDPPGGLVDVTLTIFKGREAQDWIKDASHIHDALSFFKCSCSKGEPRSYYSLEYNFHRRGG